MMTQSGHSSSFALTNEDFARSGNVCFDARCAIRPQETIVSYSEIHPTETSPALIMSRYQSCTRLNAKVGSAT